MASVQQRSGYPVRVLVRIVLAAALLSSLTFGSAAASETAGVPEPLGDRYIVQLDSPEALALELANIDATQSQPTFTRQDAGMAAVADYVAAGLSAIPGVSVETRLERLYQGLVVRVTLSDGEVLTRLGELPGVRAVYPDTSFSLTQYDAVKVTGVEQVWTVLGGSGQAGSDVQVAVIDSGIDAAHAMLLAPGWVYPSGYPAGWPAYTSPKVIAARVYFRPDDPPADGESTPVPGALGSAHGTHMAAVIAGMPVSVVVGGSVRTLTGVAPGARLMNYRVFYPSASDGYERAYAVEIIQAIEDAVADGADILCVGWSDGGDQLPFASPVADAIRAAVAQGVIVIAPAGNDGAGPGTASRLPGGIEEVLTVGAQGAAYGRALFGPVIEADTALMPLRSVASISAGADPYGCAPLAAGSLLGSAALIQRGVCPFATKAYHAQQAGAAFALIVNTADSVSEMSCSGGYCGAGVITIPSAMLASIAGQQLSAWAELAGASPSIALSASGRLLSASPELVAPFSGRGPAFGLYLKPDLIAPGVAILSAASTAYPGDDYVALSGTSIAAAHVAGTAAILLAEHPTWAQSDLKSAMMGTARVSSADALGEPRAALTVLDHGAGLLDAPRALGPTLMLTPSSVSLGMLVPGVANSVPVTLRDTRDTGTPREWATSLETSPGLACAAPAAVTTDAGLDTMMSLSCSMAVGASGDLSGVVTFASDAETYRLPVWGVARTIPAAAPVLVVDNDLEFSGGSVDTLPSIEATLQRVGVDYTVWPSDALAGAAQTWPSLEVLQGYRAIIWTLGEKRSPDGSFAQSTPPTALDQQVLMSYLDGGGRLLVMGQNVAAATDINPDPDPVWGRSTLYRSYLGSHWLQENVFRPLSAPPETVAVVGLPGTLLQGVLLDLGELGSGAGNQHSIDELGLSGSPDSGDSLVRPIAAATADAMEGDGYVMLAKADEPTLEQPDADVAYRVLHQSFGLEGVNDRREVTYARELLDRELDWLLDELTVTVPAVLVGGPYALARLTAGAVSTAGSPIVGYRWQIGVGDTARTVSSAGPEVYVPFDAMGEYPLVVEATDALGHKALAQGAVRIVAGGASDLAVSTDTALAGDSVTYTLTVRNTGTAPVSGEFMFALPAGLMYTAHAGQGVTYGAGTLRWAGALAPGTRLVATLTAVVNAGLPPGTTISGTAAFTIDGIGFTRTATTTVSSRPLLYLPLVRR